MVAFSRRFCKILKYDRPFSMDYRKRRSYARGVHASHIGYLAHGNSAQSEAVRHTRLVRNLEKWNETNVQL